MIPTSFLNSVLYMYLVAIYVGTLYVATFFCIATISHVLCRILATWMTQAESSSSVSICEQIHSQYSLTSLQMQECKKYPELVERLTSRVANVFSQHCQYQFGYEKWNCNDISPPIFAVTQPFSILRKKL